jgi:hypothetical protein
MVRFSARRGCSCAGKKTYGSVGEVERAIRELARRKRPGGAHFVKPYRCNACQGYHVTGAGEGEGIRYKGGPKNARRMQRVRRKERFRQSAYTVALQPA